MRHFWTDEYARWDEKNRQHQAGSFGTQQLREIEQYLPEHVSASAETGCGKSTIILSNISDRHHVFALDDRVADKESSVKFFERCPITRLDKLVCHFGPTQETLAQYDHDTNYDIVLIDGPHGYPFPELEYYSFYPRINERGLLLIDDVQAPTIGRLADFIAEDDMFEVITLVGMTAIFRRTAAKMFDPKGDGWWTQRYNRRRVSRKREIFLDSGPVSDFFTSQQLDKRAHGDVDELGTNPVSGTVKGAIGKHDALTKAHAETPHWSEEYLRLCATHVAGSPPIDIRRLLLMSDYPTESPWFEKCFHALVAVEDEYVQDLVAKLKAEDVDGDFVEFGIFQGAWIKRLHEITEKADFPRNVWGFDSFAGLSKPHEKFDTEFWKEGMYACSREEVEERVQAGIHPRIRLVEGFFNESLKGAAAAAVGKVCFARIDCDIYEPALDCLRFIGSRLSDGAILVFDDWGFSPEFGETRAFFEWAKEASHLRFDYLASGPWGHLYLRVRH